MIFNLPPILGLLPIFLYIYFGFKGVSSLLATAGAMLFAAVLSKQTPMALAAGIQGGIGSFLGIIGILVMLGAALAEVLKETGAAGLMVRKLMNRFGNSKNGIIIGTMASITLLTIGIGSMIAASAMVATVAVTIAASSRVSPSAMGIAFHMGAVAGLVTGPFTPPTVQMLEMTQMSYLQYLTSVSLPVAILIFGLGTVTALWAQLKYGESVLYPEEEMAVIEEDYKPTKQESNAAWGFVLSVVPLIIYGVIIKGGMTFALLIMLASAVVTGLASGFSIQKTVDTMMKGASRMVWFYLMFVLFDPFVNFVGATGAFTALADLFQPLIEAGGRVGFVVLSTMIGIFGISGAAVAQVTLMDQMFGAMAQGLGIGLPLYTTVLLLGSQITSFAYPGADMMAEMGLARSNHIQSMIINGLVVTVSMLLYVTIRAVINV